MLSLGEIEVIGFTAAVEAADAAVKTANVELVGYELANGAGMVTVKVLGQVGAVRAGLAAAQEAAGQINTVVSTQIIARPSEQIDPLIFSPETVGLTPPPPPEPPAAPEPPQPDLDFDEPPAPEPAPQAKAPQPKPRTSRAKTTGTRKSG